MKSRKEEERKSCVEAHVLAWRLSKSSKETLSNHKDVGIDRSPFSNDRPARIEERADYALEPLLKLRKQISDGFRYVFNLI
jgi:hypothetical protein